MNIFSLLSRYVHKQSMFNKFSITILLFLIEIRKVGATAAASDQIRCLDFRPEILWIIQRILSGRKRFFWFNRFPHNVTMSVFSYAELYTCNFQLFLFKVVSFRMKFNIEIITRRKLKIIAKLSLDVATICWKCGPVCRLTTVPLRMFRNSRKSKKNLHKCGLSSNRVWNEI